MFERKFWHGLIVDDEDDIHEVTELNLKKEDFFGFKLKLHHASSAAQAIEMLRSDPGLARAIAFALVDVVMESDHAGLDFCRFVRDDLRRRSMQLILRTGQPGMAAPRSVIDQLAISNYLTKIEASGDRLYMTVKAAIQAWYDSAAIESSTLLVEHLRETSKTKEQVVEGLRKFCSQDMGQQRAFHAAYDFFGDVYVGAGDFREQSAYLAIREDVMKRAESQLNSHLNVAFYNTGKGAAPVPDRIAQVDNYVVLQTTAIGTDKLATLVLKNPSYLRGNLWYYAPGWRSHLSWLAQVVASR